jgi:hypothetical protein
MIKWFGLHPISSFPALFAFAGNDETIEAVAPYVRASETRAPGAFLATSGNSKKRRRPRDR